MSLSPSTPESRTFIDNLIIGQKLGDCLIDARIGQGGMATVYRAIRDRDEEIVAVKVISQNITSTSDFVERFKREARLMQSLNHEHILPVYEFGTSGELMYIVMKLIAGGSLSDALDNGRLPLDTSLRLLRQITSALEYAHREGIVHRDLKPGNVLLDTSGNAYLTDFGIAKWKEETIGLTLTGMVMGTPGYMSPEQWRTEPVDRRTDLYALGVMTFKMLTGQLPFRADTPFSLMYKHLDEPPPLAAAYVPSIIPSIDRVLQRAMAKLPEKRYQSASDFFAAFEDVAQSFDAATGVIIARSDDDTHLMTNSIAMEGVGNAVDVGARGLISRIREYIRETKGAPTELATALLNYVEDLRQRANAAPELVEGPYKALESYDLADNKLFFGREAAIDGMLDRAPFSKFTVLHAESGAGKTSLIRAGLIPRLLAGGYLPLYVPVRVLPPHEALQSLLLDNTTDPSAYQKGTMRSYLRQVAQAIDEKREIFIFFDQFETFFTDVFEEDQREVFIREIADCIDDERLQVRIVLAMRTEYFGLVASFQPAIAQPFDREFLLRRLKRDEAQRALTMPAKAQNYVYEEGLVDEILSDLQDENEAVAPPQLQLVGTALIEALPPERRDLKFTDYDAAGRAKGVLGSYLQRILSRLPNEQRKTARLIIEALVRPDQTRDVKTAQQLKDELTAIGQEARTIDGILRSLRESHVLRLLETNRGSAYELVHDYLAVQIQLDAETAARKAAQELLQRRLGDYERFGSLLTEEELAAIGAYDDSLFVSPEARELINRSNAVIVQQKRRARALITAAVLGVISVLLIGVVFLINENENQREQAELNSIAATELAASQEQESRRLAGEVFTFLETDPMVALNLAIEALTPRGRPVVGTAELALSAAIQTVNEEVYIQSSAPPNGAIWIESDNRIIVWSTDGLLRLVDADAGTEYASIDNHNAALLSGAMNNDQQLLIGDANGTIYRYQYRSENNNLVLLDEIIEAHANGISAIEWSNTGEYFIVESQESLGFLPGASSIWNADGSQRIALSGSNPVESTTGEWVAIHHFNADGFDNGSVGIVDTTTGETVSHLSVSDVQLLYTRWVDDATLVSWSDNGSVYHWERESGDIIQIFDVAVKPLEPEDRIGNDHVAVSVDGQLLALVQNNDSVVLLRMVDGERLDEINRPASIRGVAWLPTDSSTLLLYGGVGAEIWQNGAILPTRPVFSDILRDNEEIIRGGWSPSGTLAYIWTDNIIPNEPSRIIIWEASSGSLVAELLGHTEQLRQLSWRADEREILTVGGRDNSTRIWRIGVGSEQALFSEITSLDSDNSYPVAASWDSNERRVATGLANGTVNIWETTSSELIFSFTDSHNTPVDTLAWNPDNTLLATASDQGNIVVWDTITGDVVFTANHTLDGQQFEVNILLWRSDSTQLITGGDDGYIRVWNVTSAEEVLSFQQTDQTGINVSAILWDHDEQRLLASGDDGSVSLWDIPSGDLILDIFTDMLVTFGVSWNADQTQILVWGDGLFADTVTVYDVDSGELIYELAGHSAPVTSAIWSLDEQQIITASQDQTLRVWQLSDADDNGRLNEAQTIYDVFGDTVYGLQWDTNGRLLTVDRTPSIRIWNITDGIELFRTLPDRNLRLEDIHWNNNGDRILIATRDLTTDRGDTRIISTQTDLDEMLDLALGLRTRFLTPEQRLQLLGE